MKVYKILPQGFASNTYICTNDGKTAVLVDCAQPRVYEECLKLGLTPQYVLLTHGHFDHIGGCALLEEKGAGICLGEGELPLIFGEGNLAAAFGERIEEFKISRTFRDGEQFTLCGIDFTAIATPGHTAGGMCYLADGCLFTGDTLFCESVGRCDFPTGNGFELIKSVKKLFALQGDYAVYCGHDADTTLSHERKYNPYVK